MLRPARRIENVRYAIRNVVAEAAKLEAKGREVLHLNIGDPLQFDFRTPPHLVDALDRAVRDGHNGYAPSAGILPAREAIAREAARVGIAGVSPADVFVTAGASEALDLTLTALLEPGDGVLLPRPGYPLYDAIAAKLSARAIPYDLDEEDGWAPNVGDIEAHIDDRTRAIVVCNPNNPTGGVASRAALEGVLDIARRHDLLVISDEIYDKLLYDGTVHTATASLADDVPIVTVNGLSKAYLACGWRVGWLALCHGAKGSEYARAVQRLTDARLCSPAPPQHAIAPALDGPHDHVAEMMGRLRERRDIMVRRVRGIEGLSVVEPRGAFYAMVRVDRHAFATDEELVLRLLHDEGVLFVHGSGFGEKPGTQHFRVVFLPAPDVLERAFDALARFMSAH